MDSLELDADAFYICTELSPRCYVVQKAIQIDKSQIERMVGELEKNAAGNSATAGSAAGPSSSTGYVHAPPAPPLPYWFTRECKEKMLKCESPAQSVASGSFTPTPPTAMPVPDLKQQLKAQLEYYFSRENLITDRYLRCQMDQDQYVPITVIAGFRKITQLTNDYNLILQVLRESNQVEVDERGEKVRPLSRRCTIILREIPEQHREELEKMLAGGPPYSELLYGLNDSWYVTYDTEEATQNAYMHLQNLDVTFNNKPICARIKAGGPPNSENHANLERRSPSQQAPSPVVETQIFSSILDLGPVLASYGYVPRATYRPGETIVHVEEEERTPMQGRHPFRTGVQRNGAPKSQSGRSLTQNGSVYNGAGCSSYGTTSAANTFDNRRYGRDSREPKEQRNAQSSHRRNGGVASSQGQSSGISITGSSGGGRRNGGNSYYNDARRQRTYDGELAQTIGPNGWNIARGTESSRTNRNHSSYSIKSRNSTAGSEKEEESGNITPTPTLKEFDSCTEEATSDTTDRKRSSQSASSVYSFEEQAFPSLSVPKVEPEKPTEKLSFSFVAAGRKSSKPETKKSYAEKLKEKSLRSNQS